MSMTTNPREGKSSDAVLAELTQARRLSSGVFSCQTDTPVEHGRREDGYRTSTAISSGSDHAATCGSSSGGELSRAVAAGPDNHARTFEPGARNRAAQNQAGTTGP